VIWLQVLNTAAVANARHPVSLLAKLLVVLQTSSAKTNKKRQDKSLPVSGGDFLRIIPKMASDQIVYKIERGFL